MEFIYTMNFPGLNSKEKVCLGSAIVQIHHQECLNLFFAIPYGIDVDMHLLGRLGKRVFFEQGL